MKIIIKANAIQIGPFLKSERLTFELEEGTKNFILVLDKWDLERWFENVWKIIKLRTNSIKFHWHLQLLMETSKVTDI